MSTRLATALAMAALMCGASLVVSVAKPSATAVERGVGLRLEAAVPTRFGPWRLDESQAVLVVNPQQQKAIDLLYTQVLARTYVHEKGYRVMLSMAYGDDQRGGRQAHTPELCYPAQGFALLTHADADIATPFGSVEGRRLTTQLGGRVEPVTYWLTIGNRVPKSRLDVRLAEIRAGLNGQLPDGLVFRVSSIDKDAGRAYREHDRFVTDLLTAMAPEDRVRMGPFSMVASGTAAQVAAHASSLAP